MFWSAATRRRFHGRVPTCRYRAGIDVNITVNINKIVTNKRFAHHVKRLYVTIRAIVTRKSHLYACTVPTSRHSAVKAATSRRTPKAF
jgi:hypothetical protein